MSALKLIDKMGHEQVAFFQRPEVGLRAIVAIHSTVLGPSLGGTRMRLYESEDQALEDVLRLAEGMTYKNSLAGLDIGGGKACIIADPYMKEGREELFRSFGHCVEELGGRYITAEDMGTSVADLMCTRENTSFVTGKEGQGGDPSPWTAKGVFGAIKIAVEIKTGSQDLTSQHIALQGVGHVGLELTRLLREVGARVTVSDTDDSRTGAAKDLYGAEIVECDQIYTVDCDVYSPCAMGQTVNSDTVRDFKCGIIAGAANNQLSDEGVNGELQERGILYCPDYLINSGGVISCAAELEEGGWSASWVEDKLDYVAENTKKVLLQSIETGKMPEEIALQLAEERIERVRAAA